MMVDSFDSSINKQITARLSMFWKIGILDVLEGGIGSWGIEKLWTSIGLVIIYIVAVS